MAQGPFSPAFSTDTIEVDGRKVPDIGPLPTVVPAPPANVNYELKIELGKKLFFDGRLSKNGQVSCAFCHNPGTGFADARRVSLGVGGGAGTRQAPTVLNSAFLPVQFWDGRVNSLEEQALKPIENPVEMAETHENVVAKLQSIKGYRTLFQQVFGTNVNMQGIVNAIAAYERTVISTNSPFDKFLLGNEKAMSEAALRGMQLFKGKARCILCHTGPNFTDNDFHNLGVGITEVEGKDLGKLAQRLAREAAEKEMGLDTLALTKAEFSELGRYIVTLQPKDHGAFKTPTLRSITETAPYMHDGRLQTLEEVIDFLDQGGHKNPDLSPLMQPLGLTKEEKADLLAFLKALKGEEIPFEMPALPE